MDRLIALILLQWRLGLRTLGFAPERAVGLILLSPFMLLGSLLGFVLVYFGVRMLDATRPELVLPLASALTTGLGLMWAFAPVLVGMALTDVHDVSRLLHFPVPLRVVAAASLGANLLQPAALLKLPVLIGAALALSRHPASFPLCLSGVLLTFLFMLASAQVAGLVLHGLARNRRLHDLALFLGLGIGSILSVAPLVLIVGGGRALDSVTRVVIGGDLFALSPFGWGARATVHAGRGEYGPALGLSLLALLAVGATLLASALLIERIYRGDIDVGGSHAPGRRARMPLSSALGALIEKDLRSAWRDPTLKATLLSSLLMPLILLFFLTRASAGGISGTSVLVFATLVGLSPFGSNAFGLERRGIQLLMSFPMPRWRLLLGKNLLGALLRLPSMLTLVLAGLLIAPPLLLPAALVIAVSTQLIASAVDNFLTIFFPYAVPAPGRNPYGGGAAAGRGLGAAVISALMLVIVLAVSSPFAFLAWLPWLLHVPWLFVVALPLALAGAASVYAMLLLGAASLLQRREPDLLQRILEEG